MCACAQMACLWRVLVDIESDAFNPDQINWVQLYANNANIHDPTSLYFAALEWSMQTMSTIGYGDVVRVVVIWVCRALHAVVVIVLFASASPNLMPPPPRTATFSPRCPMASASLR